MYQSVWCHCRYDSTYGNTQHSLPDHPIVNLETFRVYFYTAEHYSCCSCEPSHSESCWDRRCGPELLWTSVGETNVQNASKCWKHQAQQSVAVAYDVALQCKPSFQHLTKSTKLHTWHTTCPTRNETSHGAWHHCAVPWQHATTSTAMTIKDTKCIFRYQDMHSPVWIEKDFMIFWYMLVLIWKYWDLDSPSDAAERCWKMLKDAESLN